MHCINGAVELGMFNRQRLSENRIHSDNNTRFKIGGKIGTKEIYPNKSNWE